MNVAAPRGEITSSSTVGRLATPPFRVTPQQMLFGDHLQDGTDVLGMPPWTTTRESISALTRLFGDLVPSGP
ncbi:MAG: hypothetical protein U1G08_00495 [Verrucomicrobiota bacterium]